MIDIVRDYTAIGLGSAQATTAKVVGAAQSGAHWVATWGHPVPTGEHPDPHPTLLGSLTRAPRALSAHVQGEIDRVVQRLERHIGDLRGDR